MVTQDVALTPTSRHVKYVLTVFRREGKDGATVQELVDELDGAHELSVRRALRNLVGNGMVLSEERMHPVRRCFEATLYRLAD